ncbi:MAG: DEAD/DEAH box helicase [Nanoarchaeota archaeon]|nr:DEAD/DEAH box helicase [Nanoarchaeota archaeon]
MIESTTRTLTDWSNADCRQKPRVEVPRYKMMLKNITPRLYQETILGTCVDKNCLVVLPTGMGKTVIALMLASQRLKCFPNSKVLFLAPTRPLVEQHLQTFSNHFDIEEEQLAVFTGFVKPEKRAQLWKQAKVIFSTPQGLENDIITNKIDLSEVSLVIFDEAHRATGDYAYTFIAKQYNKKARYPRMLALTASPGSELEKINDVCKNLYIEGVELRTDADPDVRPYIQETKVQWVQVELPPELEKIKQYLKACYNSKLNEIKKHGYADASRMLSKVDLLKLQGHLHSEIAKGDKSFEIMKSVSLIAEAMKTEHAVELIETQGVAPLHNYFERIYEEAKSSKVKAVQNLASDLNFKSAAILTRNLMQEGVEHPKLATLKSLVEKEVEANSKVKIIIFNQYRESAKKIEETLNTIPGAEARVFVGQAKKNGTGLTQKEQKQMLEEFKQCEFNCLVATSVAEEGIDIPCVDLVIFYEPIPSGIRTIQRRGRTGRQDSGRVIILMTRGTRDEGYKWSAHHKEKRMYRELDNLKTKFKGFDRRAEEKIEKYIAPEMELKVFADFREKASGVIKELIDMGISVNMQTLNVGDYLLSTRVGVEYKKVPDFVDSIIDGRLLDQIKSLKQNFERPMIIIEGQEDIYAMRKIAANAIRGMLATIMVSYGIPVIQTKTVKETASLMAVIAKREQDPDFREFNPHGSRKPMTTKELQEYIVSALPGIGPTLAKPLLERFGSVKNLVNASEEELKEIEKIGEKRAKEIQRLLTERYENENNSRH